MAGPNREFGRWVTEALQWMGCTPETAAATLGIKPQTMNAMCSGIVPMRSLVIRFATEIARRAEGCADAPDWWHDVDAWLAVGGYPPRRDIAYPRGNAGSPAVPAPPAGPAAGQPEGGDDAPSEPAGAAARTGSEEEPAACYYRPVYERLPWGDSCVHIFWLLDRNETKTHQFRFPAPVDYRQRAAQLKRDLHSLTKTTFERRYARYRVDDESS
jgi:hypothetical protein